MTKIAIGCNKLPIKKTGNITISRKFFPAEALNLNHPLFQKLEITASEFYIKEAEFFDYYDIPVVVTDKENGESYVLSNIESVQAAIANKVEKIEVAFAEGLDLADGPRFMNFGLHIKKLSKYQKFELVMYLRGYLQENLNGQAWAKTIEGHILQKLATILNCSHETIKLWQNYNKESNPYKKQIKAKFKEVADEPEPTKHDPEPSLPNPIEAPKTNEEGNGNIRKEEALPEEEKPLGSLNNADAEFNEKYEEQEKISYSAQTHAVLVKPKIKLKDFQITFENDVPTIIFKGKPLSLQFEIEEEPNSLTYTLKDKYGKSCITVIANRIKEFFLYALLQRDDLFEAETESKNSSTCWL
ncbi:hypothetical protein [Segetibacter aerophilus]|uniref:Uncharacterized protein n=1 Tax=Segetibacter aerophilus TaxID=670293 RepID=A0A512B8M6_9BACT|nr:hypothetical protein [Segetibacter aerophilus]GEO08312.1 hypothetical protein SAE01_08080 [Segetibacter aerophilus]